MRAIADPNLSKEAVDKRRVALNEIPFVDELLELDPTARTEAAAAVRQLILELPHMEATYGNPLSAVEVSKELRALEQRMVDAISRRRGLDVARKLEMMVGLVEEERLAYSAARGRLPPYTGLRHLAEKLDDLFRGKYFPDLTRDQRRHLIHRILVRAGEKVVIKGLPEAPASNAELEKLFTRPSLR